ncbi:MAG: hypothetical protein LC632_09575, partial [Xanthomonadaceae bacterium]|nr:hypothetical protein [Xanthomonadaceae bacterium]
QMNRDEALRLLRGIPYESPEHLENDIRYFLKKFDWTREQLDAYLARPGVPHDMYGSESWKLALYQWLAGALAPIKPAFRRWLQ